MPSPIVIVDIGKPYPIFIPRTLFASCVSKGILMASQEIKDDGGTDAKS